MYVSLTRKASKASMEGSLKLEGIRCYLAHAYHTPIPHAAHSCGDEEDEGESEPASHRERERERGGKLAAAGDKVAAAGDGRRSGRGRSREGPQSSACGSSEQEGACHGSGPYDEMNLQQYDEMHVHGCTLLYVSSVRELPEARREEEARGGGGGGGASSRGTRAKNKALPLVRDVMCQLVCSKWEVRVCERERCGTACFSSSAASGRCH